MHYMIYYFKLENVKFATELIEKLLVLHSKIKTHYL